MVVGACTSTSAVPPTPRNPMIQNDGARPARLQPCSPDGSAGWPWTRSLALPYICTAVPSMAEPFWLAGTATRAPVPQMQPPPPVLRNCGHVFWLAVPVPSPMVSVAVGDDGYW